MSKASSLYTDREWLNYNHWVLRKSLREMGKIVGCDGSTIKFWMSKFSLPYRNHKESRNTPQIKVLVSKVHKGRVKSEEERRKISIGNRRYSINEDYFDRIDTEDKAYFLGFITADGNLRIAGTSRGLELNLNTRDIDLLGKFRSKLNSNYPIKTDIKRNGFDKNKFYEYARFMIISRKIFDSLLKLGVMKQKSNNEVFPKSIPEELRRHFIRGYFDGDGVFYLIRWKEYLESRIKIAGKREFLGKIKLHLLNHIIGLKDNGKNIRQIKGTYELAFGGNHQVYKILKYLYENASVYLERKYERIRDFFFEYNNLYYRPYKLMKGDFR